MTNAISTAGLALIREHEGFQAEPKPLSSGAWVVGYNHVRAGAPGQAVNQNEADEQLVVDLAPFENLVNALVTHPLAQAQFDALVSFAFSIGAEAFERSQVLRRVNSGDLVAAACVMDAWRKSAAGGEPAVIDALVRRRAAEKALFLKDAPIEAAPSAFVRAELDHAAAVLGAPGASAPAPEMPSFAPAPANAEPAARLTEILKSEPATEALLLTQVVPDDVVDEGEITTAHAKPVARFDFEPPVAQRRSGQGDQQKRALFKLPSLWPRPKPAPAEA